MSEAARVQGTEACVFDAYATLFDVHSAAALPWRLTIGLSRQTLRPMERLQAFARLLVKVKEMEE